MKKRNRLIVLWVIITIGICIFISLIYLWRLIMGTTPQMDPLANPPLLGEYYEINTNTILSDIENGNIEVFRYYEKRDVYPEHPSGSFAWSSADYFAIAESHLLYRTGESVDEWKLFAPGSFDIDQCSDNMQGFDKATIIFYKREPESFPVVYVEIRPLREHVYSATPEYDHITYDDLIRKLWFDSDTSFQEALSLRGSITAEKALKIAEEAGGAELRRRRSNQDCSIHIAFSDNWVVWYYWSGEQFSLAVRINAQDGTYEIEEN